MAKSESEIVEAHKTTIEALTGKKCVIKLISKEDQMIATKTLKEIENAVQKYNYNFSSIRDEGKHQELVTLRKVFCLLAAYGNTHNKVSRFSGFPVDKIRYYLRQSKNHLKTDPDFKQLVETIKTDLTRG